MTRLVGLYPRDWRDRYEKEFLAVLEVRKPSIGDRLDIVRGAIDARLLSQVAGVPDPMRQQRRRIRVTATVTALGGLGWLAWIGLILRYFRGWGSGVMEHAELGLILAFVGFLALAGATVTIAATFNSSMRPGGMLGVSLAVAGFVITTFGGGMFIVVAFVGVVVVAWSMSGRVIAHWLAVSWIGSTVLAFAAMVGFVAGGGRDVGLLVLGVPFGIAWLLVGIAIAVGRAPVSIGTTPEGV